MKHITIEQLRVTNQISVRTANCCHNAHFESLYDIISYYKQGDSFLSIRNVGRLVCKELENLCDLYLSNLSDIDIQIIENKDLKIERKSKGELLCESLSANQCLLIKQKYSELLSQYSVRTTNALLKFTAIEFIESYLFCDRSELNNLKNIGEKSIDEIIEFRSKLKLFIEEIEYIDDSPLECIKLKTISKYGEICKNDFISNFIDKHGHLPMFWILEQYVKNDIDTKIRVLINSFPIFQNQRLLSLKEIASKHNLSRERIRQIRSKLFHKTFRFPIVFSSYSNGELFHNKNDWSYLLNSLEGIDIISQESFEGQSYLKDERCNFTVEFALQIIAYVFRDIFSLLGGIDSSNKKQTWKNTFLIRRKYTEIFDFEKMRLEFDNILTENESDYLFDIEDYIANSQCWLKYDYEKTENIIYIVRKIILHEFQLYSDNIDGFIIIPASKERKPRDLVYEILQQAGKPMHLDDIFKEFKSILPNHKYTEAAQLRPYLQKHEAISFRNRKSNYTLKEWEHIKTGTIRDAIVEYLSNNDLPQTTEAITEYVLQFFPETNIASVRTSMFNDTLKRFCFFKNNIFGLMSKEYPSIYETDEQQEGLRRSFEQRLLDLELFIVEEEHFPFMTSHNSKESSLGRWWYRIINNKQSLNESQQAEVERVKAKYAEYDTDKTTYDWHINCNKLKCFILENRRLPSARGDEKFIYGWFQRAKSDFHNNRLTEEQRQKYINLTQLI